MEEDELQATNLLFLELGRHQYIRRKRTYKSSVGNEKFSRRCMNLEHIIHCLMNYVWEIEKIISGMNKQLWILLIPIYVIARNMLQVTFIFFLISGKKILSLSIYIYTYIF